MNVIWSKYVQGIGTLYLSRKLRFDDRFASQYKVAFDLDETKPLRILEIGCGPGALSGALRRWYPNAEVIGLDRDSEFIQFAQASENGVTFLEGDATALPFADNTFDVTISNTVSEHIEPSRFYGEQYRVLKPGGVCLVLSSRKGIHLTPDCLLPDEFEQQFWQKVSQLDDSMEKYAVCKYPMSEAELPLAMKQYGFQEIRTGYATVDLTPDDPKYPSEMARAMINANRQNALEAIDSVTATLADHFSIAETDEMRRRVNAKYDTRIALYDQGELLWDTTVSIIMIVRGTK
ncbi:MAG: methyltransferase domain-containing protein [Clostridia bacterium]|nr:methyltransferase domain-containing protein [Clostridia bacterium]